MALLVEGTGYEVVGNQVGPIYNTILIRTINTANNGDTLTVDLTKYGGHVSGLMGVLGWEHTTDNSVVVQTQPTTSVTTGTLTLTIGGLNSNNPFFFEVKVMHKAAGGSSL